MAKKDTVKALGKRGISEEVANVLLKKYTTLSGISAAGADALTELGLTAEEAQSVIEKIGKRAPRAPVAKAKAADDESAAPAVPMEEISNPHVYTEREKQLLAIEQRQGVELPMKVICDMADALKNSQLDDAICEKLIKVANRMYTAHLMDQNESAGVMAAHSLGEPATQMNLRTFHYAGVANINVTQGLPRIIEIVDARREPSTPSMNIPLVGLAAEDEKVARFVASSIEVTSLLDVASIETDTTNMRLIIVPDPKKMEDRGLKTEDIVDRLNKVKAVKNMVSMQDFDIVITSDEPSFKKLQIMYDAVKSAKLKGIDGIARAVLVKNNGKYKIVTE